MRSSLKIPVKFLVVCHLIELLFITVSRAKCRIHFLVNCSSRQVFSKFSKFPHWQITERRSNEFLPVKFQFILENLAQWGLISSVWFASKGEILVNFTKCYNYCVALFSSLHSISLSSPFSSFSCISSSLVVLPQTFHGESFINLIRKDYNGIFYLCSTTCSPLSPSLFNYLVSSAVSLSSC